MSRSRLVLAVATALTLATALPAQADLIQGTYTGYIVGSEIWNDPAQIAAQGTTVTGSFVYDTSKISTTHLFDYGVGTGYEYGFYSSAPTGISIQHTVGSTAYATAGMTDYLTMYHSAVYGGHSFTIAGTEGTGAQNFRFDARFIGDPLAGLYTDAAALFDVSVAAGTLSSNSSFGITWPDAAGSEQMSGRITSLKLINLSAATAPAQSDVPEPASLALVGLALAGAGAARRRKAA